MRERSTRSSGVGGFLLLLLVVCLVVRFAVWIGLAAVAIVLLVVLWKFTGWLDRQLERRDDRRAAARSKRDAIARRADEQNAWVLAGDERGIYGEYPPHEDFSPERATRRVERR